MILEEGDYEDDKGWWVLDEDTHQEGFLSAFSDMLYVSTDEDATVWESAHIAGRFLSRGKGKGGKTQESREERNAENSALKDERKKACKGTMNIVIHASSRKQNSERRRIMEKGTKAKTEKAM